MRSLALVYPPVSRITLSPPSQVDVARKDRRRAAGTDIPMVEVDAWRIRRRATDYGIMIPTALFVHHV